MFYHRNYETAKLEAEFLPTKNGISWMKFLSPLPLLITGDHDGNIIVWDIKSTDSQYRCLIHMKIKIDEKPSKATTSCDYLYDLKSVLLNRIV